MTRPCGSHCRTEHAFRSPSHMREKKRSSRLTCFLSVRMILREYWRRWHASSPCFVWTAGCFTLKVLRGASPWCWEIPFTNLLEISVDRERVKDHDAGKMLAPVVHAAESAALGPQGRSFPNCWIVLDCACFAVFAVSGFVSWFMVFYLVILFSILSNSVLLC